MKTNYFTNRKLSIYSLLGFMALLTASCGSYQSSSYYDSDGIYGNQKREQAGSPETAKSNQYKDYFSSLQNQPTQSFTNVDDYSTYNDSTTTAAPQNYSTGNPGWGEDSGPVTVNVYGNNWGYNYWNAYWYQPYCGFGWNSWYGPGWGWGSWYNSYWGYPYYGYGWNNYYYGGNHYNSGYAYHGGRRGGYYGNGMANSSGRQYSMGRRSYTQMGAPRAFTGTRSFNTRGGYSTRSYPTQSNNSYSTPRGNSGTRGYSSPSYNGGGSRGGGGYSGGGGYGGGSRGGGGGGGRR